MFALVVVEIPVDVKQFGRAKNSVFLCFGGRALFFVDRNRFNLSSNQRALTRNK